MTKTETKPKTATGVQTKVWHVVISGSYRKAKKDIVDYSEIEGMIPLVDEEIAVQMARKRYALMWIPASGNYPDRLESVREVHIDSMKPALMKGKFSYVGKNIGDMTWEELQDFAVANDLRTVPLYKKGSIRNAQNIAYAAYAKDVLQWKPKGNTEIEKAAWRLLTNHQELGFNIAKNPKITATDTMRVDSSQKINNDEMIELEQKSAKGSIKSTLTLPELQAIASSKNIPYEESDDASTLYNRIYGGEMSAA